MLFLAEATGSVLLALLCRTPPSRHFTALGTLLLVWAYSRINEIAYAFYRDPLTHAKESDLSAADRIQMAMRSYFGLAFNFALLYYFAPIDGLFAARASDSLASFWEAFYFSGVTLATLGYGDILPVHWFSRVLSLAEVSLGLLLIVVGIASYLGDVARQEH